MTESSDQIKSQPRVIVGLGEVLWDKLPGGMQLGGAPGNFAFMATQLGDHGVIASRVGSDSLGGRALEELQRRGQATSHIQIDNARPTGIAEVQVDVHGQPAYSITENVAWDYLEWTTQWEELAAGVDAVCFGSLAQRSPASRAAIQRFLRSTPLDALRIFDVNLRQPFYSADVLSESLELATVVKLSHEELPQVAEMLKLGGRGDNACAHRLIQVFDLEMVCVTRGARGSLIVSPTDLIEHPGVPIAVADTVGAGDAFTAALAHYHLRRAPLDQISEAANHLGAWVATQIGATPTLGREDRA